MPQGLRIPLVYNSGGYDSVETLRMVEGVFDIYMPDFKYIGRRCRRAPERRGRLSASGHGGVSRNAPTGRRSRDGRERIAQRGLLVRHLVLPNNLAGTDRVIAFLASLSENTYLNLMDQYRPEYRARECAELRRRATVAEFDEAVEWARRAGLSRLDKWR